MNFSKQPAFVGALLVATTLVACGSGEGPSAVERMSPAEIAKLPPFKIEARGGRAPRKLVVHDVRIGSGAVMKRGDGMLVGWGEVPFGEALEDGPHIYGQPQELSFDGVLLGWEEGMPGMRVGGRRELIVPPRFGDLPVTMVYQIDLLAINPPTE